MQSNNPPWKRSFEVLVKREAETDPRYGKPPDQRNLEELLNLGVINLDKQRGPTSHEVAYMAKKIMNVEQAGHGGTLEPYGEIPPSPASYRFSSTRPQSFHTFSCMGAKSMSG
ncbi:MAG: hypothetical protein QXQ44_02400 [Candidatus Caldarchaeum sp.]|nr:hypothetical protein [Candidatus Caldarchaeales archaeon]